MHSHGSKEKDWLYSRGAVLALNRWMLCVAALLGQGLLTDPIVTNCRAQSPLPAAAPPHEPIYWKQNLFLVPYQWSSAADPAAAQAVWLFVSRDGGTTWQKISEAKPHVKAFNYHAEADGAYAFAIRSIDATGQALPAGPYRPELFVIVDTTIPQVDELSGYVRDDGVLELRWHATDQNLDPNSWRFEALLEPGRNWQTIPAATATGAGTDVGLTSWQPPVGSRPVAVRATVFDRAGNSAVYQTPISLTPIGNVPASHWPAMINGRGGEIPTDTSGNPLTLNPWDNRLPPASQSAAIDAARSTQHGESYGWVSSSAASAGTTTSSTPVAQQWPAGATAVAPFRLSGGASNVPTDAATTYGHPLSTGVALPSSATAESRRGDPGGWTSPAAPTEVAGPRSPAAGDGEHALAGNCPGPAFQPLEPFRKASITRLPPVDRESPEIVAPLPPPNHPLTNTPAESEPKTQPPLLLIEPIAPALPVATSIPAATTQSHGLVAKPPVTPKQVGSRTFALEYELAGLGQNGVSRVALWGSRDGGQSWHHYADDEDHRSPLSVTVDDAGLYGFRIVVEAAGGPAASVPRTGDQPELWVAVDLARPLAELISIQPGSGNLADHLILRWRAEDDNLEPRPIALFYSSRPSGPWSTIATGLENTGEYSWRIERCVPPQIYLRLEVRDLAGNLAAFQTAGSVEIQSPQLDDTPQSVTPVRPTAANGEATYR